MKLEYFKYLVTIEQCQSIREAARQLYLKPQYLSNVVKNVEAHFGVTIFERHTRGVVPTEDGQYLLNKIHALLAIYNEMQLDFLYPSRQEKTKMEQNLVIYMRDMISSGHFVNIFDAIQNYFPNVSLSIQNRSNQEILNALKTETDAIGIIYDVSHDETSLPEELTSVKIVKTKIALYADQQNAYAQQLTAVSLKDAVNYDLIVYAPNGLAESMTYELLHPYGKLNIKYMIDNTSMMLQLLKKRNYYCVGVGLERKTELIRIPFVEEDEATLSVSAVYNKEAEQSFLIPSVKKIIQTYAAQVKEMDILV